MHAVRRAESLARGADQKSASGPQAYSSEDRPPLRLENGSRVAVIGGGPAGSFFSYFLRQIAGRVGLDVAVDLFEPRDFASAGPAGCNMCGGIVSESLVQHLAAEGIHIPMEVLQWRLDSYALHMDVGSVHIDTPRREKRIAAVHRGGGPRGGRPAAGGSFDGYLLGLAAEQGARLVRDRVTQISWIDGRPQVETRGGLRELYDLVAVGAGINTSLLKQLEGRVLPYRPPLSTRAYVCEFFLGLEMTRRYMGSSMHVFLLDIPRLEFAAIIPKSDFVTVCLLGGNIDRALVQSFLDAPEVRRFMPPDWRLPDDFCHCSPHINVRGARRPFADRVVFIGDSGTTRLYKDGIGAAYRTAKAAAVTAVFEGLSAHDFRRRYWPACRAIAIDNRIGRIVFLVTRAFRRSRFARRAVWRMVSEEQRREGGRRLMSGVLWDTFTGSAPYREIFLRTLRPSFLFRFFKNLVAANWPVIASRRPGRTPMVTSAMGKVYRDGEVIFRQGEPGDCMYVIAKGEVELSQRRDDQEFCLATLRDGDCFGEKALFERDVRALTARAVGDATVLTLEKTNFLRRIHEDPSLALKLLQRMSQRIHDLEAALVRQAGGSTI